MKRLSKPLLGQLVGLLAEELAFEVEVVPSLPALDQAKGFMLQKFV